MDPASFPSINHVVLTGFLQQEPELRFTPGGAPVASFRVRIARVFQDSRGGQRESVSFVTVVAWQDLAQRVAREAKENQAITVEGFLHSRSFDSPRGERRTVVEVYADSFQLSEVFLPAGSRAEGTAQRPGRARSKEPKREAPSAPQQPSERKRAGRAPGAPEESIDPGAVEGELGL